MHGSALAGVLIGVIALLLAVRTLMECAATKAWLRSALKQMGAG